ncbi:MAG TPA: hypothetical protein EYP14_18680 [Planctomycetaceae bacterium]|nr:hypothetical protein [Planctomycetaceae bacterium]
MSIFVNVLVVLLVVVQGAVTAAPAEAGVGENGDRSAQLQVVQSPETGQIVISDGERPVLQYNYRTVPLPEGYLAKVPSGARKYAVPRSDYIHPPYGPDGEILTEDFSVDHPHHRGIYWAWPEVRFGKELGDLHALQRVFARPTGNLRLRSSRDHAEIRAENVWKWEDKTPLVREEVTIRAYPERPHGREIDVILRFTALVDGVTIARRHKDLYGGLNVRLSRVKGLRLVHSVDPVGHRPRRAWSDSIGLRLGGTRPVGFAIFEKRTNPYYPGDWIQYEHLPWFQPAFPAAGVEHSLRKAKPLVLQYRFWIRPTEETSSAEYAARWDAFNTPMASRTP